MTQQSEPGTELTDHNQQNNPHAKLNRSILRLTWINLCLLFVWYLLYAEHQSGPWNDGEREFSWFYKMFLLSMVAVTMAIWGNLGIALWRRLKAGQTDKNAAH